MATPPRDLDAPVRQLTGEASAVDGAAGRATSTRIFASPLARRIARENGLAVGGIRGTGPGGRIVRDDVRRAVAERLSGEPEDVETARHHDVPRSRMRRATAERRTEGGQHPPVLAIRGSARVDALLALRRELAEAAGVRISVTDLVVAAAARAYVAVPEMNVIWLPDAVRRFDDVDVAIAVATDAGPVTPVVRSVQGLTVSALAARRGELVSRARGGRLRPEELEGGTLTVSNLGMFGTEDFTAVINSPQAAILAVGAARPEAVVTDGELGIATVLRVTLSVDHRPVDGATAARWMAAFLGLIEAPLRILV